jgi:hypothetical protein
MPIPDELLGLTSGGTTRRGKSIIATEEARTNVAYGLLTTPDRVQNIVLPADGLIVVLYQAVWKQSVAGAARAALFIGATQLKVANWGASGEASAAGEQAAMMASPDTQVNSDRPLFTTPLGLASPAANTTAFGGHVTTGQAIAGIGDGSAISMEVTRGGDGVQTLVLPNTVGVGGGCFVSAAAGTYDISVQFKASSGSVTVKDRKLWVWTFGF